MHMKKLLTPAVLCLGLILSACSSTGSVEEGTGKVEDRSAGAVKTVTPPSSRGQALAALRDPNSPLSKRSIYFDFDSYVVKPEFQSLVQTHGRFLAQNPDLKVLIQGNADERGSREYNLALGQKRAEAVKNALVTFGAREDQVEAVSLGEEKPVCTEKTEECYAQNRRADILYSGEF
ncbi:MAG: peptidoglycan-associated lipoprotein [Tepidiphilus sp.]|nr:peptidoglycan-associated lipoprotein [Tepidiphilus sp.]